MPKFLFSQKTIIKPNTLSSQSWYWEHLLKENKQGLKQIKEARCFLKKVVLFKTQQSMTF